MKKFSIFPVTVLHPEHHLPPREHLCSHEGDARMGQVSGKGTVKAFHLGSPARIISTQNESKMEVVPFNYFLVNCEKGVSSFTTDWNVTENKWIQYINRKRCTRDATTTTQWQNQVWKPNDWLLTSFLLAKDAETCVSVASAVHIQK